LPPPPQGKRPTKRFPADLDYYNIFRRLTRRKKQDARRLLNRNDPRREYFDEAIDGALLLFSRLLLAQLAGGSGPTSCLVSLTAISRGEPGIAMALTCNEQFPGV